LNIEISETIYSESAAAVEKFARALDVAMQGKGKTIGQFSQVTASSGLAGSYWRALAAELWTSYAVCYSL
jgi:hypothetical protein